MLNQSLLNYVGSSHWYKWGLDQKMQEKKRRKKEMPPKQAEEVKTMLTSLILIRRRWWCPVELPLVGQELPWQTGTVSCLPGWRLISDSDIQGRSLLVNYFSPSSPNLTQIWQELRGARIAGAAVITRTWATLSSVPASHPVPAFPWPFPQLMI